MKQFIAAALLLVAVATTAASEPGPLEAEKISCLISSIETLEGAIFIRNGSEHSPREAGEHLRMKLGNAGSRVRTAEDFIRLCASRSFLTRKPYLIKYDNDTVIETATFLREKLTRCPSPKE
ncbi:MAG: DUF5329 family protein [Desulfurivibrionaceae bacterium]